MNDLENYCNLKEILNKKIIDLSPGQTKRVMISLALLNYPDIIILENPF
jgi:ABC-type Mn2+/Zn2+ transport system ATPase subunit